MTPAQFGEGIGWRLLSLAGSGIERTINRLEGKDNTICLANFGRFLAEHRAPVCIGALLWRWRWSEEREIIHYQKGHLSVILSRFG